MTDEQTAEAIVAEHLEVAEDYNGADLCGYVMRGSFHQTAAKALDDKVALVDAIVRALQQARKEGAASVIRPPTVAQPTGMLDEDHPCDWCD